MKTDDKVMQIFAEMVDEIKNRKKVQVGEYKVDEDIMDDWNLYVSMDITDYIALYKPKDSDDLETRMLEMIENSTRGKYKGILDS